MCLMCNINANNAIIQYNTIQIMIMSNVYNKYNTI